MPAYMPIKFEIYREGNRLLNFTPTGACVMGPESVPTAGEVVFREGLLVLDRTDDHAAGVSLLWDVGPLGTFIMETTRLPPRPSAYILNVELARLRLMKIVQKLEDWNLFDFPRVDRFTVRFREAQMLFADALGKLQEPGAASQLADASLQMAVDLSESLAAFHSELLINRRKASTGFVKHIFGCRVDTNNQNQKYRDSLLGNFDYCVLPTPWKKIQPEEQEFNPAALDSWIESLSARRIPIIAGPLVNLSEAEVPHWLFIWEHDFDALRDMAYQYVQKIVHRYRRGIPVWNVCAGLYTNSAFTLSFEQTIELTRLLVAQVKNLLPNARTIITITQPFGEFHSVAKTSVPPMLYAEMVAQAGINFEGFGLEIEIGVPKRGNFARDLFQISCMLDRFSTLGRPVFLTAVSAPGRMTPDSTDASEGRLDPAEGGRWHRPWDPYLQAEWMEAVYRVALSKPFIESIAWGDLADVNPNMPGGGLFTDTFQPKPAYEKLQEMRKQFHPFSAVPRKP